MKNELVMRRKDGNLVTIEETRSWLKGTNTQTLPAEQFTRFIDLINNVKHDAKGLTLREQYNIVTLCGTFYKIVHYHHKLPEKLAEQVVQVCNFIENIEQSKHSLYDVMNMVNNQDIALYTQHYDSEGRYYYDICTAISNIVTSLPYNLTFKEIQFEHTVKRKMAILLEYDTLLKTLDAKYSEMFDHISMSVISAYQSNELEKLEKLWDTNHHQNFKALLNATLHYQNKINSQFIEIYIKSKSASPYVIQSMLILAMSNQRDKAAKYLMDHCEINYREMAFFALYERKYNVLLQLLDYELIKDNDPLLMSVTSLRGSGVKSTESIIKIALFEEEYTIALALILQKQKYHALLCAVPKNILDEFMVNVLPYQNDKYIKGVASILSKSKPYSPRGTKGEEQIAEERMLNLIPEGRVLSSFSGMNNAWSKQ